MTKGRNLKINFIVALFSQLMSVIFAFIVPKMMIRYYGPQMHGVISTITNLITYLMLVEAGLATASVQGLYKPLKEQDYRSINAGLNAISRFYIKIGSIFSVLVIGLAVVYPLFAADGMSYHLIFILILISGIAQTIEFFMCRKYRILLQADKRLYVVNFVNALGTILQGVLRILFMYMKFDIYIVQLVPAIVYVFRLIILVVYIRGHYTFLDKNVPPNYNISKKRWNALVHQVTNLVVNNTDSIVLSKAVGYSFVSIYSIYQMVVSNINGFLTQALSNAITANFGHLFVEKDLEKSVKAYDYYEKIYYYIISIIFSGCAVALYPFINLYIGEVNGLKYADYKLVILFVINAILCNLRIPQLTIVTAVGHFKETQWHAIAEAICNVLVSVILVKKLGIYGVLIGTTCSYLIRDIMFIVYVNKNIFYRNLTSTVKNLTKMVTLFTMTVCCGSIISKVIGPDTWIKWGVVSATTFLIGVIFVSIYLLIFDRETFLLILNVIGVNKIMKGKNKKTLPHK